MEESLHGSPTPAALQHGCAMAGGEGYESYVCNLQVLICAAALINYRTSVRVCDDTPAAPSVRSCSDCCCSYPNSSSRSCA